MLNSLDYEQHSLLVNHAQERDEGGMAIAAGVVLLLIGIALIVAGALGGLSFLPAVISGAILTTIVLSVFIFQIIYHVRCHQKEVLLQQKELLFDQPEQNKL